MKSLFLIPIREQDTLPVSAIELIKVGDGTETPVKFCEKNSCDDNAAGCTDNICGRHHGGTCGVNRCKVNVNV